LTENIEEVNIAKQSEEDMRAYAIYVARHRAIPDAADGLKPVIRKILWCAAHDFKGQGFIKTSNVMGQVIRKYNPHGDASVQMAIRNMINDFSTKYPTMDGSGSWGHKSNGYPAAPRYTECKISKFGIDTFIQDIYDDARSTDWQSNYDNRCMEPSYLPAKIPALLVLGQMGIAVGMKASIPSHNLSEVIDATIALMKNPNAPFCLIPDECMACEIHETDFQSINDTGMGSYIAQGIVDVGVYDEHPALFVRSLPDFTFFDAIKDSIIQLVEKGKMPYIIDIISRSKVDLATAKTSMEEVIMLKKGADPNFVREFLYNNTGIRQTRQVKLIVIKNNRLEYMNYRQYLLYFIEFRRATVFRKMNAELQTYKTLIRERQLYLTAMTSGEIDNIIKMIKKQDTRDDDVLIEYLISKLKVTALQAKFLLNTDIRKLSKGYLKKYQADLKIYKNEEDKIMNILLDNRNIDKYIINEMLTIRNEYAKPRLCRVISSSEAKGIAPGIFKLVFTKNGFIRKIGENEPITHMGKDEVNLVMMADNTEDVMLFSDLGKVFKISVAKIPLYVKGSYGIDIRILNKYITSDIVCAAREITLKKLASSKKYKDYIFIVSKAGYIKKIDIADIVTAPPSGFIFSKLDEGDKVKDIIFGPDKLDLLIYSGTKVLRISSKEVPYLKRSTKGNRVSTANAEIDGMNFLLPAVSHLVIVTKNGMVNKIPIEVLPTSLRGKAGVKVIKLAKATKIKPGDSILSIWPCSDKNILVVTEGRNTKNLEVASIPMGSTISNGVKMLNGPTRVRLS
jgi:DNA gyrase subunit A